MPKKPNLPSDNCFDYSLVTEEAKGQLIWYAGEIRTQGKAHLQSGMQMGECLTRARELFDDQKAFRQWVEVECGHSLRSAYNYMSAYEHFSSCASFAQIELTAMYALATNPAAKKKALKLADKGSKVTYAVAKKLIVEVSSKDSPPSAERPAQSRDNPWDTSSTDDAVPFDEDTPPDAPETPEDASDDDGAVDTPEESETPAKGKQTPPEQMDPKDLAKRNKQLAHSYRDKLARAVCDYHEVAPNLAERDRLVKLVQGVKLW